MFKADMHCHSTCSDGSFTPAELIAHAKEKGLSAIAITDHDTISAYHLSNYRIAEELGIILCPGVEFSCSYRSRSIHILGYGFERSNSALAEFCNQHAQRRKVRNLRILQKLRLQGMYISEEELNSFNIPVVGRPHIAQLMVEKNYVKTIREAFHKFIGENKPCFDPGPVFSVPQTIEVIQQAKGKAFIAHPHLIPYKNVIKYLLSLPFDGIECYYAKIAPQQEKKWLDIAQKKEWLISGGSDFHGSFKPDLQLGCSWINEENFQKIYNQRYES